MKQLSDTDSRLGAPAGLCRSCVHARLVEAARQSVFLLCQRSVADPRFARYPRLPVLVCPGHALAPADLAPHDASSE